MRTQYHVYLDTWCGVRENEKPKTGGFSFFVFFARQRPSRGRRDKFCGKMRKMRQPVHGKTRVRACDICCNGLKSMKQKCEKCDENATKCDGNATKCDGNATKCDGGMRLVRRFRSGGWIGGAKHDTYGRIALLPPRNSRPARESGRVSTSS